MQQLETVTTAIPWLAVYTKPRAEKKVKERLDEAGFESFLPLQTVIKQWSDRKKKIQVPLINSYVFVKLNPKNAVQMYQVPGVVGILKYLGNYAVVQEEEIENLKILSVNGVPMNAVSKPLKLSKGQKVAIANGPFKGLTAIFLKEAGKQRVIVEIETLGNYIEVTMPSYGIENA